MSRKAEERRLASTVVMVIAIAIAGEFPDLHLIFLGEGPDRADPKARANAAGIGARVILHGWITAPSDHLRGAGAAALASRFEGFPNALVEATADGCVVCASSLQSGPAEIIHDEMNGILVEPGGIEGVASGWRALLQHEGARARLAAHVPRVRERFGLESVLDCGVDVAAGVLRRRDVAR